MKPPYAMRAMNSILSVQAVRSRATRSGAAPRDHAHEVAAGELDAVAEARHDALIGAFRIDDNASGAPRLSAANPPRRRLAIRHARGERDVVGKYSVITHNADAPAK